MKVLITGGCGFLGSNLAHFYLKYGAEIIIIDAFYRIGSDANLNWLKSVDIKEKIKLYKLDIKNSDGLKTIFKNNAPFDFICHVAGQVAMTSSIENPIRDFETNALGTLNILECARTYSPEALIAFSSTNKVYGDLNWIELKENSTRFFSKEFPYGFDELLPLDFSTPYGCSKGSADQYIRDWARIFGLKTVVFRHSSIYGGRQFSTIEQGWVGWFCKKAIEQKKCHSNGDIVKPFTVTGTGKQVRDVLHVDDLISLYHSAFLNKEKLSGEIFNIGGGISNSLSLIELFNFLSEELSIDNLKYVKIPRRKSDQDFFVALIDKANHLLDWGPKKSYQEGIRLMIKWTLSSYY
tara:strand:- start:837 stop:1889 length:1053 start_codon:yes stop_codon:yes gene_type:complete